MTTNEFLSDIVPTVIMLIGMFIGFHNSNKKSEERRIKQEHRQEEHSKDIEEIKKTTKETHEQLFKKVNNHGERLSTIEGILKAKGDL